MVRQDRCEVVAVSSRGPLLPAVCPPPPRHSRPPLAVQRVEAATAAVPAVGLADACSYYRSRLWTLRSVRLRPPTVQVAAAAAAAAAVADSVCVHGLHHRSPTFGGDGPHRGRGPKSTRGPARAGALCVAFPLPAMPTAQLSDVVYGASTPLGSAACPMLGKLTLFLAVCIADLENFTAHIGKGCSALWASESWRAVEAEVTSAAVAFPLICDRRNRQTKQCGRADTWRAPGGLIDCVAAAEGPCSG